MNPQSKVPSLTTCRALKAAGWGHPCERLYLNYFLYHGAEWPLYRVDQIWPKPFYYEACHHVWAPDVAELLAALMPEARDMIAIKPGVDCMLMQHRGKESFFPFTHKSDQPLPEMLAEMWLLTQKGESKLDQP